jgi:hypothetical protein
MHRDDDEGRLPTLRLEKFGVRRVVRRKLFVLLSFGKSVAVTLSDDK